MANDQDYLQAIIRDLSQYSSQLISASLVNAFYSALILKKQSGVPITIQLEKEVLDEVLSKNFVIQNLLLEAQKKVAGKTEPFRPM